MDAKIDVGTRFPAIPFEAISGSLDGPLGPFGDDSEHHRRGTRLDIRTSFPATSLKPFLGPLPSLCGLLVISLS